MAGEMHGWLQLVLGVLVVALILAAAVIDARERRFPHALALSFAFACAAFCVVAGCVDLLIHNAVLAALCSAPLLGFELVWRRTHDGTAGIGMGDLKFLAAFILACPRSAIASFALGLAALALAGMLTDKRSFPLLPFVAPPAVLLFALSVFPT